jgi:UDP-2-acetamido-3-amino-2,3-dideoxy-glucuronate N-acetyltransferase
MKVCGSTKIYQAQSSNIGECEIGSGCILHSHIWIGDGVIIGNRCRVQAFVYIPPGVIIEDDVFLGPRVTFTNDKYPPSKEWRKTLVKSGARIGAGAIILPGITIGRNAVVGAGSVVTRSIPDGETWVGNPAKPLVRVTLVKGEQV